MVRKLSGIFCLKSLSCKYFMSTLYLSPSLSHSISPSLSPLS